MKDLDIQSTEAQGWLSGAQGAAEALSRLLPLMERYGMTLTPAQQSTLLRREREAVENTGRILLGPGVLPKLAYAFCDSPFLQREEWAQTLGELTELFYALKSDGEGFFTDDELVAEMADRFNQEAQGSLEYMAETCVGDLLRQRRRRE